MRNDLGIYSFLMQSTVKYASEVWKVVHYIKLNNLKGIILKVSAYPLISLKLASNLPIELCL